MSAPLRNPLNMYVTSNLPGACALSARHAPHMDFLVSFSQRQRSSEYRVPFAALANGDASWIPFHDRDRNCASHSGSLDSPRLNEVLFAEGPLWEKLGPVL